MSRLELRNICKKFGKTEVLRDISLSVEDGEFLSLVGQSGCGKSTLLRIIAGLETPSRGEIMFDGKVVTGLAPKHRNIAMVFQDYALYPHMSVAENMSMPLVMARMPIYARLPLMRHVVPAARRARPGIEAQVATVAGQLRIDHLLSRKPAQLSGGQRQRVALGRALVRDPSLFLMDEPLSNLDAKLRVQVRREITELHASSDLTFVYVTHDQIEAMTMSDRVALMQDGRVLQVGPPNTLYADPVSIDVARFIGSPEINLLPVQCRVDGVFLGETKLHAALPGAQSDLLLGLRPEAMSVKGMPGLAAPTVSSASVTLPFIKGMIEDLGPEVLIHGHFATAPEVDIRIRAQKNSAYGRTGRLAAVERLEVTVDPAEMLAFGAGGKRVQLHPQRSLEVASCV